jgi:hypothetical protein
MNAEKRTAIEKKIVVYRCSICIWEKTNNKPWGTIEEMWVGKFNDFTDKALSGFRR